MEIFKYYREKYIFIGESFIEIYQYKLDILLVEKGCQQKKELKGKKKVQSKRLKALM